MLQLKVRNIFTDIEGNISPDLYVKLQQKMAFRPLGYEFSPMFNKWILDSNGNKIRRMWDGWKRQIWKNKKRTFFPTGLLSLAKDSFNSNSIQYQIIDYRIKPDQEMSGLEFSPKFVMRDYQQTVINQSCSKQRGIIQIATGGGKTCVAAGIIQKLKVKPFIFFVTSIDLLVQAKESLEEILRYYREPIVVGQIGGGIIDIHDINIMTIQTAVRCLGAKWDKDYKFDSDDQDDNTPIQNKFDILTLLKTTKGSISDECISGDSIVRTRQGLVPMRELKNYIGKDILSFNGNSVVWKQIINFYSKGKKKILEIALENGNKIKCTEDHQIMTKQGWMPTGKICHKDQILCYANADVAKKFALSQENILPYTLKKKQKTKLSSRLKSISPITCSTKYVKVNSVSFLKKENVFDITVEGTHSFFANGFLVHNCQHWKAETCLLVARSLENSYYTYGLSATPYRDEGDDLMIQGCFGKNIAKLSASQLIKENWLIRPSIKIIHIRGPKSKFRQWQQLYKDQVTENTEYNEIIASIANSYIKVKRLVLVLVQQIKHGKILSEMIPGSVFLSGASSKKSREKNINKLRSGEISCIVSTVIFDEGIDVRPLDTVILAGQGKSKVRAMQRIGRILRLFPGKKVATAIDFRIHQKYLLKHSIAREKMYKTEPEYNIEHIDS